MAEFIVALFGRFQLQCNGKQIDGIEASKVKELLSFLLIHREETLSRESLAELFWEDLPPAKSKKYLRQAIWKLRSALEMYCQGGGCDLVVEADWIRLDPSPAVWQVDVIEFEQSCLDIKDKRARELSPTEFSRLQRTVNLCKGDLLEGCYQGWCIIERERFQASYMILLNKLIQYCEISQQVETGLIYGEMLLRYDRAYELAHRQMMRLYYMAGDRTRALRQYERCVVALREELGIGPADRTIDLYEQIKADRHNHRPNGSPVQPGPQSADRLLINTAKRLDQYVERLNLIQSQIQEEINSLENRSQTGQ